MHHLRIFLLLIFLPSFLVIFATSCDDETLRGNPTLTSPVINLNDKGISNLIQIIDQVPDASARSNAELLLLNKNTLTSINAGELDDFVNLTWLSLQDNQITNVERNSFAQLKKLERLYLRKNRLAVIEADVFPEGVNLNLIDLGENQFITIPLSLISADLAGGVNLGTNLIATVPANFAANTAKLTTIVLNSNKIKTIPKDAFANNGNLREIFLNNNLISTIEEGAFSGSRIYRIDLPTNELTSVPGLSVPVENRVRSLSLRSNSIAAIGASDFDRFAGTLQVLRLEGNPLDPEQVDDNAFTKLTNLLLFFVEYRREGDTTRLSQDDPAFTNLRSANKRLIIRDMR